MTDTLDTPPARAIDRRTILKAGAWAAPAIAVAAAVPAAAASTTTWNLVVIGPQAGGSQPLFTSALTGRYSVQAPIGAIVYNDGDLPSPAGFTVTLTTDSRLWAVGDLTYTEMGSGTTGTASPTTQTTGDVLTVTWTVPLAIAANTPWEDGIRLRPALTDLTGYPNDHLDDPESVLWTVTAAGEAVTTDNTFGYAQGGDTVAAAPYGGALTAQWENVTGTASDLGWRPTHVEVTSVGPNPLIAGDVISVSVDSRVTATIAVANLTVDGSPASNFTIADTSGYHFRGVQLTFQNELPAGSVVAFDLVYTTTDLETAPTDLFIGYTSYASPSRPSEDSRLVQSYDYRPR